MTAPTVGARPRTLDEAKEFLRARLAQRRSPMAACDAEAAGAVLERLEGLDSERWAAAWSAAAAPFEAAAREAEARGDAEAAAAAYFQAYAFYFLGRYPCPNHPAKQACAVRARENYLRAGRYFDPPLERVAIPFAGRAGEGTEVVAYVRKPAGVARPPVLVLWGGIDGYKEERHANSQAFLARGFATVAVDMPGTGESPVVGSPDAERQFTPLFDWIRAQPDLDGGRIAGLGSSFGGYWATKLAHTHRAYLTAVVSWGGGAHHGFQPDWIARSQYADSYLMDLIPTRAHMLGVTGYDEYVARVGALSLLDQGVLDQPCAPLLLVNGKDDRQTPIADLYLVLEHGDPKAARVFPGGHMGDTPDTLPTIIRWLCDRVASR
ncbi:MAG TPA: alpha/beta fold hydrolase [Chloroflexota bacterium]|nr:alpha/beta fold hydrolase [Chloroflexota bacterium]